MKASEFIKELQGLIEVHGDLEVVDDQNCSVDVSYDVPPDDERGLEPAFLVE